MFIWMAVSFKAIGSSKDVLSIYSVFSNPSTDIVSNVTDERYGSISCFGNSFSKDYS